MCRKCCNNTNNTIKIVAHTLHFCPFSWCYAHPSTAPLGIKVSGFMMTLLVGWVYDKSASGVLCQEEYDVLVSDFFTHLSSLFTSGHLYMFASGQTLYSSTVHSSRLHPNLLCMLDSLSLFSFSPLEAVIPSSNSLFFSLTTSESSGLQCQTCVTS